MNRTKAESIAAAALLTMALPVGLVGQHVVEGRVVEREFGSPLEGITVELPGEGLAVETGADGVFRVTVPETRPGVTLQIEVSGYAALRRTWVLPLDGPITVALDRMGTLGESAIEEVEVRMDERLARLGTDVRTWVADRSDIRWEGRRRTRVLGLLSGPLAELDIPCAACATADGGIGARVVLDGQVVDVGRLRALRVDEVCRLEVVRRRTPEHPSIRIVGGAGGIHVYRCRYMDDVAAGRRALPPELEPWYSWGSVRGGGLAP